ncbi:sigma-E factor negative regulatory protein [Aggregatibacter actinomycetemcomitans]|uniref:sigma-E factor negative regulatory protein n=1 Tax=Aggregatibacter actinomycetemcomitans TaxID=714 RepID=UPI0006A74C11|nr:sigma-E factor negative regulatory protein [Aggregatibacter actinomycetemcomitans]KOE68402.1 sigma-E factor negative regulatory protein [Aggregatibacter actinomycetemcomitans serotype e str. SCC393]
MQKELLSAYIDGEQVSSELTEQLCQDAELQESWANFHTIRAVMRQETNVFLSADFTAKMESLIAEEEIVIAQPTVSQPLPQEVESSPFMQKLKSWFAPITQVAVAASVCLVAVLGVQSLNSKSAVQNTPDTPVLQTLPFNNGVQEVSYNAPSKDVITTEQLEQKNKRIGAMLQSYEFKRRVYGDSLSLEQTGAK